MSRISDWEMQEYRAINLSDADAGLRILQGFTIPEWFIILATTISIISLIACLFIMMTFVLLKQTRKNAFCLLVLNISVADFIAAFAGLIDEPASVNPTRCIITAILRDFGIICSYFFTVAIGWIIFVGTQRLSDYEIAGIDHKLKKIIVLTYIVSLLGAFGPYFTNNYCVNPGGCWMEQGISWDLIWFLTEFSGPTIFTFGLTLYYFWRTAQAIERKNEVSLVPDKSYKRLFGIPIIFLICNVPGSLFSIFCMDGGGLTWLRLANSAIRNGQGVLHCLMYALGIIGGMLRERFKTLFGKAPTVDERRVNLLQTKDSLLIY